MGAPIGQLTRGTTGYNRLRRSDRWLVHSRRVRAALLSASDPLVVDLGYGALPVTTLEMAERLRMVRNDVRVIGLEIHPDRVQGGAGRPKRHGRIRARRFRIGRAAAGSGARVQRVAPVPGRGGGRRVVDHAAPVGSRRPDRRRHVRRARPAVLLGAARRERTAEPDTGLRPVRHRAPVRSRGATTEGADPSQHRGTTDPHAADAPPTARGPASPAMASSVRECAGAQCWICCAPTDFRWSRRAGACATAFSPCRGLSGAVSLT